MKTGKISFGNDKMKGFFSPSNGVGNMQDRYQSYWKRKVYFEKYVLFKIQLKVSQNLNYSIRKTCAAINPDKCEDLVKSMPGRVKDILKTKG